MLIPCSTYRIQLNDSFTLGDLAAIVDYLHELGISTIYASPIFAAVRGSRHGYDVTDVSILNPEIGTEQQLDSLADTLHGYGMSWLQDIVPNHMAYDPSNPWLYDVLERGCDSVYYPYFDILSGGKPDGGEHRLMAPFLGSDLSECLDRGEISLEETRKGFVIRYFDHDFPVAVEMRDSLTGRVALINSRRPLLEQLLHNQHYLLTNAREAKTRIDYRRFFTINGLICLRMEEKEVFETWHRCLHRWYDRGWIDGLRVDHIDGLADPKGYLLRLRRLFGQRCFIVAEKILTGKEGLPDDWPLEGTTGYDFLASAGQLLTDAKGAHELLTYYRSQVIGLSNYETIVYENKLNFLYRYMGGELDHLLHLVESTSLRFSLKMDPHRVRQALAIWMASFPVYRAYPDAQGMSPEDRAIFIISMEAAKGRRPDMLPELDFLAGFCDYDDSEAGGQRLHFLSRLMQWTGPLAAKGIEDTTFYQYNPYISHCEVGDSPSIAGIGPDEFHQRMLDRQSRWRHTINATTTHDTKRGEDSRIRLSFLSAIPREWIDGVTRWREINRGLIKMIGGRPAPSPNDEYLIYQSLLGGFPEDGILSDDDRERFAGWLVKALREAKTETSYDTPDEAYEMQCQAFVTAVLRPDSLFLSVFTPFASDVIRRSGIYCLSQLMLKLTAPGIPDIYQGAELWELSYVDPDNRRAVDFGLRVELLRQIKAAEEQGAEAVFELLSRHRNIGIEKLFLLYRVLNCRRQQLLLFTEGEYIPVTAEGPLLSYLRRFRNDWALVIVPLLEVLDVETLNLILPANAPATWTNVFTGAGVHTVTGRPFKPDDLPNWPIVLLTGSTGGD